MSALTKSAIPCSRSQPRLVSAPLRLRLSTTTTWWPAPCSRAAAWLPMKPAPPVMTHFFPLASGVFVDMIPFLGESLAIEAGFCGLPAGVAQAAAEVGVVDQSGDRPGEGVSVARWTAQCGDPVLEELVCTAVGDRDHRPAAGHPLDDHPAERLGAGAGVNHHVQCPDRPGGISLVAGEPEPPVQPQRMGPGP